MKKQAFLLTGAGLALLAFLWFGGSTVADKPAAPPQETAAEHAAHSFDIQRHTDSSKKLLTPEQAAYISSVENSISRGAVKDQQEKAALELARFWGDSLHNPELALFYTSEAAMLVNSEKNLTFAARQILKACRNQSDPAKRNWKADLAIRLLEKAIDLNPANDSLKVDLGACYIFGKGMTGDANETMKGIQQLLQVVKKDSANMQAQLVLGIGGVLSTQYDKAIDRLLKVVKAEPGNAEAVSWLAEAYAAKGDKSNAVKWFNVSKQQVNNPEYSREIDNRIREMK